MKKMIVASLLLLAATFSFAQTQTEMNEQEHNNFLKTDKELNSTYQKILKDYKDDTVFIKNFKASQKIWLQFRDAEMKMRYPEKDHRNYGSIFPACWSMYLTRLTNDRIATLKQWLEGTEEGDGCAGSTKIKSN